MGWIDSGVYKAGVGQSVNVDHSIVRAVIAALMVMALVAL